VATLEIIQIKQHKPSVPNTDSPETVNWLLPLCAANKLPMIVWASGETWGQANLWADHLAEQLDPQTVMTSLKHLYGYAQWLEAEDIEWWHFPEKKSERCLFRFRRALVDARDGHEIAPSTASARMAAVLRFYRWAHAAELIIPRGSMWDDQEVTLKTISTFGLERTIRVMSSELKIPNRKVRGGFHLEEGLLPVTEQNRRDIQSFADRHASNELSLMLAIGFGSGLRIGTICDLKIATLKHATIDPFTGWRRMDVGPAARPPVKTKLGVSGKVPIWEKLHTRALEYATSSRRLKRQAKAAPEHRDLLFLNRYGKPFTQGAVTTEMCRLRSKALDEEMHIFRDFHFHRSRATFATLLMRVALKVLPVKDAVDLVRESCLHANADTTMGYVKFIEQSQAMMESADAFTEAFLGLSKREINCD
jgi:integrase